MLNNRKEVIDAFKIGIFPYVDGFQIKEEEEEESDELRDVVKKFIEYIENESKRINYDLLKDYFNLVVPSALVKQLYATKNDNLVEEIKSRRSNLKEEKMSQNEKEIKQPDTILKIIKEILNFNKEIQKQRCLGLKILRPDQILSRLPITLAQLNTGNNSGKRKNEIRSLLYLCTDKKNLKKMFIKVWLILYVFRNTSYKAMYKNGNNPYEH